MTAAIKGIHFVDRKFGQDGNPFIIAVITDMGIAPKIGITGTNQVLQMLQNLEAIIVSLEFPADIRGCDALVDLLEGNQVVIFFRNGSG